MQNKQSNARDQLDQLLVPKGGGGGRGVITMLIWMKKHEDKEQDNTLKHESPRRINHKATPNKNSTGTTALERSVA